MALACLRPEMCRIISRGDRCGQASSPWLECPHARLRRAPVHSARPKADPGAIRSRYGVGLLALAADPGRAGDEHAAETHRARLALDQVRLVAPAAVEGSEDVLDLIVREAVQEAH